MHKPRGAFFFPVFTSVASLYFISIISMDIAIVYDFINGISNAHKITKKKNGGEARPAHHPQARKDVQQEGGLFQSPI